MAFCTNCGAKLADDAKFCTECGAPVGRVPPEPTNPQIMPFGDPAPAALTSDDTYSATANDYTYTPPQQDSGAASGSYTSGTQRNAYSYDPAAAGPGAVQPPRPPHDIPGGSQSGKKRSAILPILLIVIAAAALVILLFGIFRNSDGADNPACGVYIASYGTYAGDRVEIKDMWPGGFTVELLPRNKCRVVVDDKTETCRYELDKDGEIEIDLRGDDDLEGRLNENCLTLEDVMDSGVNLVFYKEGTAVPAVNEPAATEAPAIDTPVATAAPVESAYSWWNGDWYGWWAIYDAGGEYTDFVDSWSDVCATISVDGDSGLVDIWDDTCEEGTNLGYIDVAFKPGKTNNGRMLSESGYFLIDDVNSGDWVVDPGDSVVSRFDQMICIHGTVVEHDNSENWVEYIVFLRPWGMSWEDVRSDACEDMPYSEMMPYYYDEWYVPQMNGPMPDYFDFDLGEAA